MPSLLPEERAHMLGRFFVCGYCHRQATYRWYCRSCDDFFTECAIDCPNNEAPAHRGHRVYAPNAIESFNPDISIVDVLAKY